MAKIIQIIPCIGITLIAIGKKKGETLKVGVSAWALCDDGTVRALCDAAIADDDQLRFADECRELLIVKGVIDK